MLCKSYSERSLEEVLTLESPWAKELFEESVSAKLHLHAVVQRRHPLIYVEQARDYLLPLQRKRLSFQNSISKCFGRNGEIWSHIPLRIDQWNHFPKTENLNASSPGGKDNLHNLEFETKAAWRFNMGSSKKWGSSSLVTFKISHLGRLKQKTVIFPSLTLLPLVAHWGAKNPGSSDRFLSPYDRRSSSAPNSLVLPLLLNPAFSCNLLAN